MHDFESWILQNPQNAHARLRERGRDPTQTDFQSITPPPLYPTYPSPRLKAACIIVHTEDGTLARIVAKYHPHVPVLSFTSSQKVAKQVRSIEMSFVVVVAGGFYSTERNITTSATTQLDTIHNLPNLS